MHSNDLEACGIKLCCFWFHSDVKFLTHSLYSGERQWPTWASCFTPKIQNIVIPSQQCWRVYSNAAVRVLLSEWVCASVCPSRFALWTRYRLQFLSDHFQTSHVSCGWWVEEPYWFLVTGSKVKFNFGTLCIRPWGQGTEFSFSPITLKLACKLWMMRGGTLLILGQGSRSTLALCI